MLAVVSGMMMLNLCGCFALFAGGVAAGGTAVWLSGKLAETFQAGFHHTIEASHSAMHQLNFPITHESQDDNDAAIKGTYTDGREIWIDIHRISDHTTKVEVRVGANPDKEAAGDILRKIHDNL
jgi:hypothetical protein